MVEHIAGCLSTRDLISLGRVDHSLHRVRGATFKMWKDNAERMMAARAELEAKRAAAWDAHVAARAAWRATLAAEDGLSAAEREKRDAENEKALAAAFRAKIKAIEDVGSPHLPITPEFTKSSVGRSREGPPLHQPHEMRPAW